MGPASALHRVVGVVHLADVGLVPRLREHATTDELPSSSATTTQRGSATRLVHGSNVLPPSAVVCPRRSWPRRATALGHRAPRAVAALRRGPSADRRHTGTEGLCLFGSSDVGGQTPGSSFSVKAGAPATAVGRRSYPDDCRVWLVAAGAQAEWSALRRVDWSRAPAAKRQGMHARRASAGQASRAVSLGYQRFITEWGVGSSQRFVCPTPRYALWTFPAIPTAPGAGSRHRRPSS